MRGLAHLLSPVDAISPLHRGYPIEQLALHSSHLETAYLLIYGALPTRDQYQVFEREVLHLGTVHSDAEQFFRSFRYVSVFQVGLLIRYLNLFVCLANFHSREKRETRNEVWVRPSPSYLRAPPFLSPRIFRLPPSALL